MKRKVLFVSQETVPFLSETEISKITRNLPQGIHEAGKEIRVFMPKYGCINERRHQLHEVIRLSGMNLIIDDSDHPLIIKVASIPSARMQVYFIDNEEYFQRKAVLTDDKGKFFEDNDERSMFFCKGVLETVKKLGWTPDIIHCHGWMSALLPLYVKKAYVNDPHFADTKVVYTAYENGFDGSLDVKLSNKLVQDGFNAEDLEIISEPSFLNINKLAATYSDGVIHGSATLDPDFVAFAESLDAAKLSYQDEETYVKEYSEFYDRIAENDTIFAE